MGIQDKAADWQVGVEPFATLEGNTLMSFRFKSSNARISRSFFFAGSDGVGSFISAGNLNTKFIGIKCNQEFSLSGLDQNGGFVSVLAIGAIFTVIDIRISAWNLFSKQSLDGGNFGGIGFTSIATNGIWKLV